MIDISFPLTLNTEFRTNRVVVKLAVNCLLLVEWLGNFLFSEDAFHGDPATV